MAGQRRCQKSQHPFFNPRQIPADGAPGHAMLNIAAGMLLVNLVAQRALANRATQEFEDRFVHGFPQTRGRPSRLPRKASEHAGSKDCFLAAPPKGCKGRISLRRPGRSCYKPASMITSRRKPFRDLTAVQTESDGPIWRRCMRCWPRKLPRLLGVSWGNNRYILGRELEAFETVLA